MEPTEDTMSRQRRRYLERRKVKLRQMKLNHAGGAPAFEHWKSRGSILYNKTSKYKPHQGEQECYRRRQQLERRPI